MLNINPNKYLRKAYIDALVTATGLPGWDKKLPKNVAIPAQYFLITSQTKQRTEVSKDCYEWLCQLVVDIVNIDPTGYASSAVNDDIEQIVIQTIQSGITVQYFDVKSIEFLQSLDLDVETPAQSVYRRVVTYQHWLQENIITT